MFGKLKEKLRSSLSIFSKKAEEEAEIKEEIIEKEVEKVIEKEDKPVEEIKAKEVKAKVIEEKEEKEKKEAEIKEEVVEKEKKKGKEKLTKEIAESTKEEIKKEVVEGVKEKKGFFSKLFKKKDEEEDEVLEVIKGEDYFVEETKEEADSKEKKEFKEIKPSREIIKRVAEEKAEMKEVEVPEEEKPIIKEVEEKKVDEEKIIIEEEKKLKPEKEIIKEDKKEEQEKTKPEIIEKAPKKKSFFSKIKETITTKTISADKFEELFWDLELALLENNVSVEVIQKIKEDLKKELVDKPLPRDVLKKIEETLKNTLEEILSFEKVDLIQKAEERKKENKPLIIAFFGINGTGKTTSIAKLTHYFQQNNLSVVLAACDTFRAAAIQQLEEHAKRLSVKMIKHDYGSDAAAVAFDAVKYAEKNNIDVVMIDTAGRLHSNTNLMAELEKIIRVVQPDLKVFVGESITGNDCIEQAQRFNELVEMDGAILTKADVDEKGGAPLSIAYTIKKPILFLGVGQEYKDLEEFDKEKMLHNLGF